MRDGGLHGLLQARRTIVSLGDPREDTLDPLVVAGVTERLVVEVADLAREGLGQVRRAAGGQGLLEREAVQQDGLALRERRQLDRLEVADGDGVLDVFRGHTDRAPGPPVEVRLGGVARDGAHPHLQLVHGVHAPARSGALEEVVTEDVDVPRCEAALEREAGLRALGDPEDLVGLGHVLRQVEVVAAVLLRQSSHARSLGSGEAVEDGGRPVEDAAQLVAAAARGHGDPTGRRGIGGHVHVGEGARVVRRRLGEVAEDHLSRHARVVAEEQGEGTADAAGTGDEDGRTVGHESSDGV